MMLGRFEHPKRKPKAHDHKTKDEKNTFVLIFRIFIFKVICVIFFVGISETGCIFLYIYTFFFSFLVERKFINTTSSKVLEVYSAKSKR